MDSSQIYRQSNDLVFKRITYAAWAIITIYFFVFSFIQAWLSASVLLIGSLVVTPLTLLIYKKGKKDIARLMLGFACATYVFICGLGLQFATESSHFYGPVAIISFLIFPSHKIKKSLYICVYTYLLWSATKLIDPSSLPNVFAVDQKIIDALIHINHFASLSLTVVFLFLFVRTINDLRLTLEKRSQEREQINAMVTRTEENAKIGSWSYDIAENNLRWSDQTYRIHELEVGSNINVADAINFYHPDDQGRITKYVEACVEKGTPYDDEFQFITAKGRKIWVRAIGKRYVMNGKMLMEGSFQDITQQKIAETAKDEFLANMSHEIRTPLNGVLGTVELLKDTPLNEEQQGMVNTVQTSGQNLLSIINSILDISKIRAGMLELESTKFSLYETLVDSVDLFSAEARKKEIHLNFEYNGNEDLVLVGDMNRVKQIISNLISNAIKFTQLGSVTLVANIEESVNDIAKVRIDIIDTGKGISHENLIKIFQPFSQADATITRHFGGTGLGLSICLQLSNAMGGDLTVVSELGKGTTFTFEVNLKISKSLIENYDSYNLIGDGNFANNHPQTILLVEDNLVNQKIATKMLEKLGYSIDVANNGQEALVKVNTKKYTIVFMDMQMPILDGVSATEKIIENHGENAPYIIALTANAFVEDRDRCFKAGMKGFMAKPVQKDEFKKAILDSEEITLPKAS